METAAATQYFVEEEKSQYPIGELHSLSGLGTPRLSFRNLVKRLGVIGWVADAQSLQFSFLSPRAEEILGYPTEQWLQEPSFWVNHIHPADRERVLGACRAAAASRESQDIEYRMLGVSGREVWLRNILYAHGNGNGRGLVLRGIMLETTNRRQVFNRKATSGAENGGQCPCPCGTEKPDEDLVFSRENGAMARIRSQVDQVARFDVPVLILGESGVGKEVVARLIHQLSPRTHRTFLKVNCAAIPSSLLESELFGYEAGAFTGAARTKPGIFELGHKGTILLDEIGEMSPDLQAKLLHVLQDKQFPRLGGRTLVSVDVRIVAATNVDIQQAMEQGQFRRDLFYRLSAFRFRVPPLRERRDDIPLLLEYFMDRFAAELGRNPLEFSATALEACRNHRWPGNVRELQNFVVRYLILEDESAALEGIGARASEETTLPDEATGQDSRRRDLKKMVRGVKAQVEKEAILEMLEQTQWVQTEAARRLNISTKALTYKMRNYGFLPRIRRVKIMPNAGMLDSDSQRHVEFALDR